MKTIERRMRRLELKHRPRGHEIHVHFIGPDQDDTITRIGQPKPGVRVIVHGSEAPPD